MEKQLKFREDGTFKILQFTDVHWKEGEPKDIKTSELMTRILEAEKPDLVVFTGDTVYSEHNDIYIKKALEPVCNANIPWAFVFGNHDTEVGADRETLFKVVQETGEYCLAQSGDVKVGGVGNYHLTINSSSDDKAAWTLYFLDSSDYNKNKNVGYYGFIARDQIDWYVKLSTKIKKETGNIPALSFFHIPLPEYNEVWDFHTCYGEKLEDVCCPDQNSGLFSAMLEMGDVKGVFVGHDHINDYCGELHGIKLCYGRATGYNTYSTEGYRHGARIINLLEGQESFETYVRLEDGEVIINPVTHEPKGRVLSK